MHCLISHFNTVSVTRMYLSNGNHVFVLRFTSIGFCFALSIRFVFNYRNKKSSSFDLYPIF